jgi:predicted phage-related endonuclease
MQTFGFTEAYVAVLFAGRKYVEILVEADEFEQATNLQLAERFRAHVLEDRQPEFDGADSTLEAVKKMHPAIDDTLDPVELGQLGVYYFVALQEFEAAQSKLNEMKTRVLAEMKTAKRGLVDDQWVLSRQSRNGGTPYLVTKKG